MISGNSSYGSFLLRTDRVPGEAPLPYVKTGRLTFIAALVLAFHAALIVVPMIFLAISEMIKKPPVYVMRLPTVDSVPSEHPSPHPSPLNKKSKGTPDKGKPLSEIPKIPELVKPIEPPKPKPQVKPVEKKADPVKKVVKKKPDPVKPKTVAESKKTVPVRQTKPKKTVLSPSDIKISHKRVKNPSQDAARQKQMEAERARQADERARQARNAEMAKTLRSLSGTQGGTGTPGGGGGPRGIVSKEVNEYYSKVEEFLKRRWDQPSVFGDRPKVLILFKVAADGRVISVRIEERSGNAAMDASVENLLRGLKTLPAPPQAMEFTVTMEIDR